MEGILGAKLVDIFADSPTSLAVLRAAKDFKLAQVRWQKGKKAMSWNEEVAEWQNGQRVVRQNKHLVYTSMWYVYVYVYMYVCRVLHISVHILIYKDICRRVYVFTYVYTYECMCLRMCIHTSVCVYACVYKRVCHSCIVANWNIVPKPPSPPEGHSRLHRGAEGAQLPGSCSHRTSWVRGGGRGDRSVCVHVIYMQKKIKKLYS